VHKLEEEKKNSVSQPKPLPLPAYVKVKDEVKPSDPLISERSLNQSKASIDRDDIKVVIATLKKKPH
jgi:hypothetical protein